MLWTSPISISKQFGVSRDSLYRHAHVLGPGAPFMAPDGLVRRISQRPGGIYGPMDLGRRGKREVSRRSSQQGLGRAIDRVEVSVDGGRTWSDADVDDVRLAGLADRARRLDQAAGRPIVPAQQAVPAGALGIVQRLQIVRRGVPPVLQGDHVVAKRAMGVQRALGRACLGQEVFF